MSPIPGVVRCHSEKGKQRGDCCGGAGEGEGEEGSGGGEQHGFDRVL